MQRKDIVCSALTLTVLTVAAASLLIWTAHISEDRRALAHKDHRLQTIAKAFPEDFDNDPLQESTKRINGDSVYPLYRGGRLLGHAIETTAPNGYSGDIHLLIGVDQNNAIVSVQVLAHRETPGLGDRIDPTHGWINGFAAMHSGLDDASWKLVNDGGQFSNLTGASITARAVLRQVQTALLQHDKGQEQ